MIKLHPARCVECNEWLNMGVCPVHSVKHSVKAKLEETKKEIKEIL